MSVDIQMVHGDKVVRMTGGMHSVRGLTGQDWEDYKGESNPHSIQTLFPQLHDDYAQSVKKFSWSSGCQDMNAICNHIYSGNDQHLKNRHLMDDNGKYRVLTGNRSAATIAEHVRNMHELFHDPRATFHHGVTLYNAFNGQHLINAIKNAKNKQSNTIDYHAPVMLSTTTNPNVPTTFEKTLSSSNKDHTLKAHEYEDVQDFTDMPQYQKMDVKHSHSHFLTIHVAPRVPILPIEHYSANPHENEVVLNHGAHLRIDKTPQHIISRYTPNMTTSHTSYFWKAHLIGYVHPDNFHEKLDHYANQL